MTQDIIKVPTAKGLGNSFKDFGIGTLGGLILILAMRLFGGLGFIAAPLLAGSMLKGDSAKVITTIAGVGLGMSLFGGGASADTTNAQEEVM